MIASFINIAPIVIKKTLIVLRISIGQYIFNTLFSMRMPLVISIEYLVGIKKEISSPHLGKTSVGKRTPAKTELAANINELIGSPFLK